MTIRLSGTLLGGGLLILAALAPEAASAAPPVRFDCSPTQVRGIASDAQAVTDKTTFVNIPETAVTFRQGGSRASCVIVRFSAEVLLQIPSGMEVRAMIDDTMLAFPRNAIYLATACCALSGHTFEFVFPNVRPGIHTLRMEYRSESTDPVFLMRHNTIVHFER